MSESGDYTPSPWSRDTSFKRARQTYDNYAGRSYQQARAENKTARDLVVSQLVTQCSSSLFIVTDHTGSMGKRTAAIFSKLGYLEHELRTEYFGKDYEVCFCAVGDYSDNYPCEVRDFARTGPEMQAKLKELVIEGGGGGNQGEEYQLTALYLARNVRLTKSVRKPIIIFIGDEQCHPTVTPELAAKAHITLTQSISTREIFEELKAKYSVWMIHLPYGTVSVPKEGENWGAQSNGIRREWAELLGAHRVVSMPDPERVVDIIYMILGEEVDRRDYSEQELRERQGKDKDGDYKIATVLRAMEGVSRDEPGSDAQGKKPGVSPTDGTDDESGGKSKYHGGKPKRRAKRLI